MAFAAAQVCLLFTLALLRRLTRGRRPYLVSWTAAVAFFTAGAGALWYGSAFGWSPVTFRVYYICGALLGVPWLALGQLQLLLGPRRAQLPLAVVGVFSVVAGYVLALSPFLHPAALRGGGVPNGALLYGTLPRALVGVSNGLGSLVLVVGVGWSVARLWRAGAAARARAAGLAMILLGAVAAGAGGALTFLGHTGANAIGILIGVTAMYAGFVQTLRRIGRHRAA